jgi:putative addiction module component (TIGR02574 family)
VTAARDLLKQALSLPPEERAEIACELLDSLGPPDVWTEEEGSAEIERRARRVVDEGPSGEPWSKVRADIERELKS